MADQVIHQFDEEHAAYAIERQKMYPKHANCPPAHYDWAQGPVCGCGTALLGCNPPVGDKGEQMRVYDRDLVNVPVPAFLRDGTLIHYPGKGWFRYVGQQVSGDGYWSAIDNPSVEPYWGDPVNQWTPLKKGERVQVTGGEHFVNWLGTAQGEMMDGTEQVIVDGKDSPWSFSPKYLVRVQDLTDREIASSVKGTFSEIPDTDEEHELAAGVYPDTERMDEIEKRQLVLVLPFRTVPNTNACRYIFGDETQASRLGEWAALFVKKQADYGNGADDLGMEGQYAELHRKITKLRRAMWEGVELQNEPLNEVLMDLIGHCFLAMMYNDNPGLVRHKKGGNR